jgi:uncharacterized membrane protein
MADFTGSTRVEASADALFDYLSDVSNLPRYFARMTSAEPGEGEEVRTTASMPDGTEVGGDAWFRVDPERRHLEWGSEGPSSYGGQLDVTEAGSGAVVELRLHTTRAEPGDQEVQDGIDETLAKIKELTEGA